jgi:hypothetical protein
MIASPTEVSETIPCPDESNFSSGCVLRVTLAYGGERSEQPKTANDSRVKVLHDDKTN